MLQLNRKIKIHLYKLYFLHLHSPWWCKCENGSPHGDPACFPDNPKDIVFIPQVRGIPGQGRHPNDTFPDVADRYDTVLAYNEPNQPDQADIQSTCMVQLKMSLWQNSGSFPPYLL